jgi:16S rRNA (cytosine1402-N4)-methyltransferase
VQRTAAYHKICRRGEIGFGRTKEAQDRHQNFQALRIAVYNELEVIAEAIPQLIALLQPNARIAVIAFHSLEDRIIKQTFQRESRDCICPPEQPICTCGHRASIRIITPHPIEAGEQEKKENPRARSAKLRVAEKLTKMA